MRNASDFQLGGRLPGSGKRSPLLLGLVACIAVLLTSAASAQTTPSTSEIHRPPTVKVCSVFAFQDAKDQPKQLRALCKGQVLFLGPVTEFETIENEALNAQLVDARFGEERRIWLLTIQDDGHTLLEDLNGQIARAAGRGPMSKIDGIALDFQQFAQSGQVGVLGRPEDRSRARADKIELGQQIALERSRHTASATKN